MRLIDFSSFFSTIEMPKAMNNRINPRLQTCHSLENDFCIGHWFNEGHLA